MVWISLAIILVLIFAPFFGWFLALYLAHKTHKSIKLESIQKKLIYSALTIASILPFHSILVYPLVIYECKSNGGEKIFTDDQTIPKNIVIDGKFYNIRERYPVANLLLNEMVNSIYYTQDSHYGEGHDIRSAAENYTRNSFSLRVADPSDVACGPFYHYTENKELEYHSKKLKEKCIAYEQVAPPNSYLKIRKTAETERTIKTGWRTIDWENITYDIVSNDSIKKIREVREFYYKGYTYPIFLNFLSLASYSCRANTDPDVTLNKILHNNNQQEPLQKTSKKDAKDHLNALQRIYFGFEMPKEVQKYDIMIFDNDNLSSLKNPLKINIILPESELPIMIELYTNKFAESNIINSKNQNIFASLRVPLKESKVTGMDLSRVIETTTESYNENHLRKFYSAYFTRLHFDSTKHNRYHAITLRAKSIETDINLPLYVRDRGRSNY